VCEAQRDHPGLIEGCADRLGGVPQGIAFTQGEMQGLCFDRGGKRSATTGGQDGHRVLQK